MQGTVPLQWGQAPVPPQRPPSGVEEEESEAAEIRRAAQRAAQAAIDAASERTGATTDEGVDSDIPPPIMTPGISLHGTSAFTSPAQSGRSSAESSGPAPGLISSGAAGPGDALPYSVRMAMFESQEQNFRHMYTNYLDASSVVYNLIIANVKGDAELAITDAKVAENDGQAAWYALLVRYEGKSAGRHASLYMSLLSSKMRGAVTVRQFYATIDRTV